jgi:hypothetical protein
VSTKNIKRGRPTTYSIEWAGEICFAIASTNKGIKRLCKDNSHWPNQDTLFAWLKAHSEFSEQYARAKEIQIEGLVEEILEIADDSSKDYLINEQGKLVFNGENINRARLKIDTRKWLACKLLPKIYGNKVDNTQALPMSHEECLKLLM